MKIKRYQTGTLLDLVYCYFSFSFLSLSGISRFCVYAWKIQTSVCNIRNCSTLQGYIKRYLTSTRLEFFLVLVHYVYSFLLSPMHRALLLGLFINHFIILFLMFDLNCKTICLSGPKRQNVPVCADIYRWNYLIDRLSGIIHRSLRRLCQAFDRLVSFQARLAGFNFFFFLSLSSLVKLRYHLLPLFLRFLWLHFRPVENYEINRPRGNKPGSVPGDGRFKTVEIDSDELGGGTVQGNYTCCSVTMANVVFCTLRDHHHGSHVPCDHNLSQYETL